MQVVFKPDAFWNRQNVTRSSFYAVEDRINEFLDDMGVELCCTEDYRISRKPLVLGSSEFKLTLNSKLLVKRTI